MPDQASFHFQRGLKGICKPILNGFFEDFIINVINEALKHKEELHENSIDSNDVIQRITRQLMCD